jgi:hypothetical protein
MLSNSDDGDDDDAEVKIQPSVSTGDIQKVTVQPTRTALKSPLSSVSESSDDKVDEMFESSRKGVKGWILCYQSWYCQRQCKRMKKADGAVG